MRVKRTDSLEQPDRTSLGGVTGLILCGGRGSRLRPLTDSTPKPLLPVNGRCLLDHLVRYLHFQGVNDFILCTGYKAEAFDAFAGELKTERYNVRCMNTGDAGISERLRRAGEGIAGRTLVCYADTLADVNLASLARTHSTLGVEATVTVYPYHSKFGLVHFDDNGIATGFVEKPQLPYWINIGFLLCERTALDRLEEGMEFPDFLSRLAGNGHLGVYRHRGRHWTANTEKELRELAEQLRHNEHMDHHYDTEKL